MAALVRQQSLRPWSWWRFSPAGSSAFRSTSRLPPFLASSARVICAALALAYGSVWMWAEILSTSHEPPNASVKFTALQVQDGQPPRQITVTLPGLARMRQAARLFPLNHAVREQPAIALIRIGDQVPPQLLLAEIDEALRHDPHAADFLHDRGVLLERMRVRR